MKPQHSFIAERPAAQHCAELLRAGPPPAELLPALGRTGERIARAMLPGLAGLLGDSEPQIAADPPAQRDAAGLSGDIAGLAANSLLTSAGAGLSLLASIDGAAMLRLVDRAFGGCGDAIGMLPDRFPLSAELMIRRVEDLIEQALREAFGLSDLAALRRDSDIAALAPFAPATDLAVLRLTISEGGKPPWHLLVAVPLAQLPALLGNGASERPAMRPNGQADPAAAPFAEVPLPLTATLVDMRVPLSTLAVLEPGAVLPVAINRAVPIASGGTVLARGTIGTNDDRIAVRLTQIA